MTDTDTSLAKVSLRDILFIIFSKKDVLIGVFLIIVALTVLFVFITRPVYKATSKILVKPASESTLPSTAFYAPPGRLQSDAVPPEAINSEIEIIKSDELLRTVVEELGQPKPSDDQGFISKGLAKISNLWNSLMDKIGLTSKGDRLEQQASALRARLIVKPVTMSNMIEISLKGTKPEEITKTVNVVTDRYIDRHIEIHQSQGGPEFFDTQTKLYLKQLQDAENALKEFLRQGSIIDIKGQRDANLKLLEELKRSLSDARAQIAENTTRLGKTKEDREALTSEVRQTVQLDRLSESMLPLLVERARISTLYPKTSIEYQDITGQLDELTEKHRTELKNLIAGSEIDLSALISREEALAKAVDQTEKASALLTQEETELNRLNRDVKQNEKLYLLYKDKTEESRIERQQDVKRVANVAVASWAHKPSTPVFPNKPLMLILAIVVGFVMGVAGSFIAYYMDHTVKMPSDLPRHAETPIISTVGIVESGRKG